MGKTPELISFVSVCLQHMLVYMCGCVYVWVHTHTCVHAGRGMSEINVACFRYHVSHYIFIYVYMWGYAND